VALGHAARWGAVVVVTIVIAHPRLSGWPNTGQWRSRGGAAVFSRDFFPPRTVLKLPEIRGTGEIAPIGAFPNCSCRALPHPLPWRAKGRVDGPTCCNGGVRGCGGARRRRAGPGRGRHAGVSDRRSGR